MLYGLMSSALALGIATRNNGTAFGRDAIHRVFTNDAPRSALSGGFGADYRPGWSR